MALRDRPNPYIKPLGAPEPPPEPVRVRRRSWWLALVLVPLVAAVWTMAHGRPARVEAEPPGYCSELLSFCLARRFEQPGEGYHVKAYCAQLAGLWKPCAVVLWNGRTFSYGQGGSVKVACFVEEARLDPRSHVAYVRGVRVALTQACNIVQLNA